MDQSNQHDLQKQLGQTTDSMEELGINQGQGSQTAAETQLLATITGDSDSQRNIGENSEEAWRDRKRKNDRRYRDKQRDKRQELEVENDRLKQEIQQKDKQEQRLKQEIQQKDKQEQLTKSKLEAVEAENASLKCELEEKKQLTKSLLDVIGVVKQQQVSTTDMQPLLTQIKRVVDGFVSKVDELQQTITQSSGTHVYTQPWQPQHNILISQVSQAATTTLPLTQLDGTSRMQQTIQSPRTFTEDSHGLPDFLQQEQLGQTAHTINVSSEFGLHQGQGGNTAVESQPFTQGLSDQDADLDEFFSSFYEPQEQMAHFNSVAGGIVEGEGRKRAFVGRQKSGSKQTTPLEFRVLTASLVAENDPLKPETQKKQELCHEDQQMKSNVEAFEAENKSLKRKIKEKERRMKLNLKAFLVDYRIVKNQIGANRIKIWKLEREIKEKEWLMKSGMEAFEAKNDQLKLEIGLKAFKAQNERLECEVEENKQRMKSNLKALEANKGKLEHEIQAKEQLMKSNLETLEAQIRQLLHEFESPNVANVSVDQRMQTQSPELAHLEINSDKLQLN